MNSDNFLINLQELKKTILSNFRFSKGDLKLPLQIIKNKEFLNLP